MYGTSPEQIIFDNKLMNPDRLVVGQTLVINNVAKNPNLENSLYINPVNKRTIIVNGYTYPNTDPAILSSAFPYLTYISIFSYQVLPDGNLTPIDDQPVIEQAIQSGVAPKMVVTNIEQGGDFSSELAREIFTSDQAQDRMIQNILNTMSKKDYVGVDIDFEYLYPEDRERYNDLLEKIRNAIHPYGYILSAAIAPKTSAQQPGLLYEAHDYSAHGYYDDEVIIMTYEWGYTYGPPMAVAPINEVEKVIQYAVTEIPSRKILMGIPNYGYIWELPYVQGSAATVISNPEAVNLAARVNAAIQYDYTAQSPFFNYYDERGIEHIVWFEDARSIYAKLQLVEKYNLGGVSYWTVNNPFPQNWLVLRTMFDIMRFV